MMQNNGLFGRYTNLEKIGEGATGIVYKAFDPNLQRIVALKVIRPELLSQPGFADNFLEEARKAARLEHPHIVTIFDSDKIGNTPYFTMTFVEGTTLAKAEPIKVAWSLDRVLSVMDQITSALNNAHNRNIVHRDIKPENILLDADGKVFLTDFSIARAIEGTSQFTGTTVGTAEYMAPEQAQGKIDKRSDIYSLGIVLYKLLTGQVPFRGPNLAATLYMHTHQQPLKPSSVNSAILESVERVVLKALDKNPDNRYQTARELYDALESAARETGTTPAQEQPRQSETVRIPGVALPKNKRLGPAWRNILLTAGSLVLVLLFVGTVIYRSARHNLAQSHSSEALKFLKQTRYEEAIQEARKSIVYDKNDATAHAVLGYALLRRGNGGEYERTGNAEEREAIRLQPDLAVTHLAQAVLYHKSGQLDQAKQEYEKAIAQDANFSQPHVGLGNIYYEQSHPDRAEQEYTKAIKISPQSAKLHDNLGNAYYIQGHNELAKWEYEETIRLDPKLALPHFHLGFLYQHQKKPDLVKAEEEYNKAVQIDSSWASPHKNLGYLYQYQKNPTDLIKAEEEYNKAIHIDPKDAWPHVNLGYLYQYQEKPDLEKAKQEYEEAIRLNPNYDRPHFHLGNLYKHQEKPDLEKAKQEYEEAIRLNPNYARSHNSLGALYQYQEKPADLEKAKHEYEEAIRIDSNYALPHNNLGDLYRHQEKPDLEKAKQEYEKASQLEPTNQAYAEKLKMARFDLARSQLSR